MLSAKNVVKSGYSVFIRQTTSAGVVWLLTTLSHSLYIVYKARTVFYLRTVAKGLYKSKIITSDAFEYRLQPWQLNTI